MAYSLNDGSYVEVLVKSEIVNYDHPDWYIKLYVRATEVGHSPAGSTNPYTTVDISMYVDSRYEIGPWTDYGSYLGVNSSTDTINAYIGNARGRRQVGSTVRKTIYHNASSGEGSCTIQWKWGVNSVWGHYVYPSGSYALTLPTRIVTTACKAPTSVGDGYSPLVTPGASRTLRWSGAASGVNNGITSYTIFYKDGELPTTSSYTGTLTSTSTSCTVTAPTTRGLTRYFKVRANGAAGASYYSPLSTDYDPLTVNTLPSAPTVSVNRNVVPSNGGSVTFNVTAGSDSDGQSYTTYYSTSVSGTRSLVNKTLTTGQINANTDYYFWTWDGLEYSTYNNVSIYKNTPIVINSFSLSGDNCSTINQELSGKNTLTWGIVTRPYSIVYFTLKAYYCNDEDFSSAITEETLVNNQTNISSFIHTVNQEKQNQYIRYKLSAQDSVSQEPVVTSDYSSVLLIPQPLSIDATTFISYNKNFTENYIDSAKNQFNEKLFSTWTNPIQATNNADLKTIKLEYSISTTSSYFSYWKAVPTSTTDTTKQITLGDMSRGNYLRLRISFIDKANFTSSYYTSLYEDYSSGEKSFIKANLPTLFDQSSSDSKIIFNNKYPLKPLSNNVEFVFPKPVINTANLSSNITLSDFSIKLNIENVSFELENGSLSESESSYTYSITSEQIKEDLSELSDKDTAYSGCTLEVQIKDVFGNYSQNKRLYSFQENNSTDLLPAITSFIIDFKENPVWAQEPIGSFILNSPNNEEIELDNWETSSYPMVNPLEKLVFTIPNYSDLNSSFGGETFYSKIYYLATKTENSLEVTENDSWIDGKDYYSSETNTFTLFPVNENTIIRFAIKVFDSTNLSTSFYIYEKGVELCRKTDTSNIIIDNFTFNQIDSDFNFSFTYDIQDLGGSRINSARKKLIDEEEFSLNYTDRRNLERTYAEYSKSFSINIIYSIDRDFTDSTTVELYNSSGSYSFGLNNYNSSSLVFPNLQDDTSYYVKLQFIFTKDSYNDDFTYYSNTFYVIGSAPLVSYRKGQVSINKKLDETINENLQNSAFAVSKMNDKDKIVFVSTDENGDNKELIFDLTNGTIGGTFELILTDNDNW